MNCTITRPADADTLHAELDALQLGPYSITWDLPEIEIAHDAELTPAAIEAIEAVVAAHDGTTVIAAALDLAAREATILADGAALVAAARSKRLAGVALAPAEVAALLDAMLFASSRVGT